MDLYAAQQRQAQAMMVLGSQISSGTYGGAPAQTRQETCFSNGEYTQGFNKVCQYSCTGSAHAVTLRSTEICPPTVKR